MVVFLTSSPTGPLDNSRFVDGVDEKNYLIENLKKYWKDDMKCLYITATPDDFELNDRIIGEMCALFEKSGFQSSVFDILDRRIGDFPEEYLNVYDMIFLGGGHVPTQNKFFTEICLRGKIKSFRGVVLGISAGTMNAADMVYAQPEEGGEAIDPNYVRFMPGLGLTNINILPHYQMVKDFELDGMRLYEEITCGDSYGNEFLVLPDGSYVLIENGETFVWGEAYVMKDGEFYQICADGDRLRLE